MGRLSTIAAALLALSTALAAGAAEPLVTEPPPPLAPRAFQVPPVEEITPEIRARVEEVATLLQIDDVLRRFEPAGRRALYGRRVGVGARHGDRGECITIGIGVVHQDSRRQNGKGIETVDGIALGGHRRWIIFETWALSDVERRRRRPGGLPR